MCLLCYVRPPVDRWRLLEQKSGSRLTYSYLCVPLCFLNSHPVKSLPNAERLMAPLCCGMLHATALTLLVSCYVISFLPRICHLTSTMCFMRLKPLALM
jgi:hypothetical protein